MYPHGSFWTSWLGEVQLSRSARLTSGFDTCQVPRVGRFCHGAAAASPPSATRRRVPTQAAGASNHPKRTAMHCLMTQTPYFSHCPCSTTFWRCSRTLASVAAATRKCAKLELDLPSISPRSALHLPIGTSRAGRRAAALGCAAVRLCGSGEECTGGGILRQRRLRELVGVAAYPRVSLRSASVVFGPRDLTLDGDLGGAGLGAAPARRAERAGNAACGKW